MKYLLFSFLFSANVMASSRVILNDKKIINFELNDESIRQTGQSSRCGGFGLKLSEVTIFINGLSDWTFLNHSTKENLLPLKARGCNFEDSPPYIYLGSLFNGKRTEQLELSRQLVEFKVIQKDVSGVQFCHRSIQENISTSVTRIDQDGSYPFSSSVSGTSEKLPLAECSL